MLNAITSYLGYRPIFVMYDVAHNCIHIIKVTHIIQTTIVLSVSHYLFSILISRGSPFGHSNFRPSGSIFQSWSQGLFKL